MKPRLSKLVVIVCCVLSAWNANAALDITIVNTSNRIGSASVNGYDCDLSDTCFICPNTSVHISSETLAKLCGDQVEECKAELNVASVHSAIGIVAYRGEDGILYVAGSKWKGYSARMLANDVAEIYQINS